MRQTFTEYLRTNQIIHIVLTLGQLLFVFIVFFIIRSANTHATTENYIIIIGILIAGLGIFASISVSQNRLKSVQIDDSLSTKLKKYRDALMYRYLFLEGASVILGVAAFLTNDLLLLIPTIVITILMFFWRTDKQKIINELNLDFKEEKELDDPHFRI